MKERGAFAGPPGVEFVERKVGWSREKRLRIWKLFGEGGGVVVGDGVSWIGRAVRKVRRVEIVRMQWVMEGMVKKNDYDR